MAEYIDRNELNKKKKYLFQTKGMPFPKSEYFIKAEDFSSIPNADVVERSKFDMALEQTYKVREMVLHSNRTYEANDVLDIIDEISAYFERHIGE